MQEEAGALKKAVEERAASVTAYQPHRTSVVLLLDAANRELDKTEGELLKLFPSERARVSSYLVASRGSKSDSRRGERDVEGELNR